MSQLDRALALASMGFHVFPCREKPEVLKGKTYKTKSPYPRNGLLAGTIHAPTIRKMWAEHPGALIGVWCGPSGILVLDIDVETADGKYVKDGWASLDEHYYSPSETFQYTTLGGEGTHYVYIAPEGVELNGNADYRGLKHVDRRAGNSYVVWTGDIPLSRAMLSEAPEWLCDVTEVRTAAAFEGSVKTWFEGLEQGEPSLVVRKAIDRARARFDSGGNDLNHSDIIELQHEAIRLGAEGHPGVEQLLNAIEGLALTREGSHSRPPELWAHEFAEGLASGIKKHGDAIELRKNLPSYSLALVPDEVLDSQVNGLPGSKSEFNELLGSLTRAGVEPLATTSVLWSAPRTRDIAREWGLEFVHKRVLDAQTTPPAIRDNPAIPDEAPKPAAAPVKSLLTPEQIDVVLAHPTFIDDYLAYSKDSKGWVNREYAVVNAWTLLSMAFGCRAMVPVNTSLPLNLWFITLGYSGTGKTVHFRDELRSALDLLLKHEGEAYYNLGAGSSPEAMHEALLERDKKPSMILHDEAADFFEALARKEWVSGLKDNLSDWYGGWVPPVNKIRLKELKGKSAQTSFNIGMVGTPERMLENINLSMFSSGFMARVNWTWGEPPEDNSKKFRVTRKATTDEGLSPLWYDCVADLISATRPLPTANRVIVDWSPKAESVLVAAHEGMDLIARSRDYYMYTEPSVTRLKETMWKCAALLSLYRGDTVISEVDALTAVYYAQRWFDDLFRVVGAAGQGEFSGRMDEMEAYIRGRVNGATEAELLHRFRSYAKFNMKDVDAVLDGLLRSARVNKVAGDGKVRYVGNG